MKNCYQKDFKMLPWRNRFHFQNKTGFLKRALSPVKVSFTYSKIFLVETTSKSAIFT